MITPFKTTNNLTVTGNVTASNLFYDISGNSSQWNTAYSLVSGGVSSGPLTFNSTTSATNTLIGANSANNTFSEVLGGVCNLASGNYSTIVNGFSSCATGYATFVGAGSGIKATGNYAVAIGGQCNTSSGCYSVIGGGIKNSISSNSNCAVIVGGCVNTIGTAGNGSVIAGGGSNIACYAYSSVLGGFSNCVITCGTGGSANSMSTVVGGRQNVICCSTTSSGYSIIGGGYTNCICSAPYSSIVGGQCNFVGSYNSTIGGGVGNYNPLRDSQIVGGVANHTGGLTPFNITAAASISGNGTQTCLIGTGIQTCFSYPFNAGNVSVYYGSAATPLSAGVFSTATIAATGTNYIIINGDYSTCTGTSLSATSIYVYDRAINNTGYDNFVGGGKLNTASGCYGVVGGGLGNVSTSIGSFVGGGFCNKSQNCYSGIVAGCCNTSSGNQTFVGAGRNNTASGQYAALVGGKSNTSSAYGTFVGSGVFNTACSGGSLVVGGYYNTSSGTGSIVVGGGSTTTRNCATGNYSIIVGGISNTASGAYSFVAGGSANDTKGFANTFILGTALSAFQANYTYVNNISSQGLVYDKLGNSNNWNTIYTYTSSSFTAIAPNYYMVDTTSGPLTATLPVAPYQGAVVGFIDPFYTWYTNNLVLSANVNIEKQNQTVSINLSGLAFKALYVGGIVGWRITQ